MGYFGDFKTAADGRMLFFPWHSGFGYIIPSNHDCRRLQQQIKAYEASMVMLMGLFASATSWGKYSISVTVVSAAPIIGLSAFYSVWMRWYLLPRLLPSRETQSERDVAWSALRSRFSWSYFWMFMLAYLSFRIIISAL